MFQSPRSNLNAENPIRIRPRPSASARRHPRQGRRELLRFLAECHGVELLLFDAHDDREPVQVMTLGRRRSICRPEGRPQSALRAERRHGGTCEPRGGPGTLCQVNDYRLARRQLPGCRSTARRHVRPWGRWHDDQLAGAGFARRRSSERQPASIVGTTGGTMTSLPVLPLAASIPGTVNSPATHSNSPATRLPRNTVKHGRFP